MSEPPLRLTPSPKSSNESTGPIAVGVQGTSLTGTDRERLAHPLVGMVILFSANYESPEQLIRLCSDIHALRDPPLLIAVDHEGGRVQRFREGFTRLPPMRRLGELWDRDVLLACRVAASLGYVMAAELRAHGVDMTFAPVLDVDHGRSAVIGDRALHSDPRVISMLAAHLTHGLLLAGMANCGKHFPGTAGPRPTRMLRFRSIVAPAATSCKRCCAVSLARIDACGGDAGARGLSANRSAAGRLFAALDQAAA